MTLECLQSKPAQTSNILNKTIDNSILIRIEFISQVSINLFSFFIFSRKLFSLKTIDNLTVGILHPSQDLPSCSGKPYTHKNLYFQDLACQIISSSKLLISTPLQQSYCPYLIHFYEFLPGDPWYVFIFLIIFFFFISFFNR